MTENAAASAAGSSPVPYKGVFRWFTFIQASWFFALGIQFVLFPYLVADRLAMPPHNIGLAQAALTAPSILLMLFAGALADRLDKRRMLVLLHLLAVLPAGALATLLFLGRLEYEYLIIYALFQGLLGAFINPARDALLNHVATLSNTAWTLQRAVTVATAIQFTAQLSGMLVAMLAAVTGAAPLLVAQGISMLIGCYGAIRVPPEDRNRMLHDETGSGAATLSMAEESFFKALRSPVIVPLIIGMFAVGILFVGSYLVMLPILVRDDHGGGVARFALFNVSFWLGTILSTLVVLRLHVSRPGRAVMIGQGLGAVLLLAIAESGSYELMVFLCFAWGASAGVAMVFARSMIQEAAPPKHRGKMLALFNLGLAGGAPLGAVVMGVLIGFLGVQVAVFFPVIAMGGILAGLFLRSRLWWLEAADDNQGRA